MRSRNSPVAGISSKPLCVAAVVLLALSSPWASGSSFQSHKSIEQTVKTFLTRAPGALQGADIDISVGSLDPRLRLKQCSEPLRAFPTGTGRRIGSTTVGVRCEGESPWTLYVTARVSVYAPVVVAVHPLDRGQTVQKDDLQLSRKDLSTLSFGYLTSIEQAVGKTLERNVMAGTVVQPNLLNEPAAVRRGESVTLNATAGGIEVRMAGKALEDGAIGERIRVRNLSSSRVVEGTVRAGGVVKVDL